MDKDIKVWLYDKVSDEMIWGIVIKYIPKLKTEISDLLATSD